MPQTQEVPILAAQGTDRRQWKKAITSSNRNKKLLDKFLRSHYHDMYNNVTKNNIIEFNRIISRELLIYKRPNRVSYLDVKGKLNFYKEKTAID
ncbi:MAG: hypothetical protein LBH78_02490 [Rickettsiales bacterium]|nr:hypothetical protein [Rickettsiales bacterium]